MWENRIHIFNYVLIVTPQSVGLVGLVKTMGKFWKTNNMLRQYKENGRVFVLLTFWRDGKKCIIESSRGSNNRQMRLSGFYTDILWLVLNQLVLVDSTIVIVHPCCLFGRVFNIFSVRTTWIYQMFDII